MTINNLNVNPHRIEQTRDYKKIFTQLNFLLMLTCVILFAYPYSVFSAPKTPSQALPKMFQQQRQTASDSATAAAFEATMSTAELAEIQAAKKNAS